jgi:pectate lyase
MKKTASYIFQTFLFGVICFSTIPLVAQTLAFPGAEGYGKYTTGGRGGEVIYVDNLNDSGPGSFRAAVKQDGPRIVVFSVSGTIKLESPITIYSGDLTIAGQTAPAGGITIRDYTVELETDNVIVRFMRFRLGDVHQLAADAFSATEVKDIIIDHCSMSWGIDEVSSFYRNQNFTLQWSIISESLANSYHPKGRHGYAGIWGGQKATFHHNLIAHHTSRNPRLADSDYDSRPTNRQVDFYNNVIYNWGFNSVYGGEMGEHNIVNNYFKAGPATDDDVSDRIVNPSRPYGKFFVDGNVVEGFPEVTESNWSGGIQAKNVQEAKADSPFSFDSEIAEPASSVFDNLLATVGASLHRDAVDERITKEVKAGTATYEGSVSGLQGIIDSQKDVGGWPELEQGQPQKDTDKDGMPDVWEQQKDLNANEPADATSYTLHDKYTNIEVYLNERVEDIINPKK